MEKLKNLFKTKADALGAEIKDIQSSALAAQAGHDQTVCAPEPIEAVASRKKMASS